MRNTGRGAGVTPRVVSLVPSATETLCAWGMAPVAVTRFCEHPELPSVGGTKNPDLAAIVALEPDVVVMCIEENRREDAEQLRSAGLEVHALDIDTVDDVAPALTGLADALGLRTPPSRPLPDATPLEVRAFVPIWRRPWMTISGRCYGASMLARLGVDTVFSDAADRYPTLELGEARTRAVDVVLAPSEPYPFDERHRAELEAIAPVQFVDGKDLFWWGTRTPDALDRLASVVAHRQ
jgi:ABC-type Fe3+-hydroxamate transport system substrate-binding protein